MDDSQPEVDESFICRITSVSNQGQVGKHTNVSITILASDKPYGEYLISKTTRAVFAMEPFLPKHNGSFTIG